MLSAENFAPQKFAIGGHGSAKHSFGPALIDDDTPIPAHARFSWLNLSKLIVVGLILWGGAIGFPSQNGFSANRAGNAVEGSIS